MITNEENKRMKHIKVSRLKKVSLVSASVECMKDKEPEWSNQEVYHDDDDDEGSNDNSNDSKSSGVVYNGNDNKVEDSVSSVKENRLNEQELYNASGSDKLMYILEHFLADLDVGCSAVDVNCKPYDAQRTPLHNAAYCGAVDCADCLLQWGARVDELDYVSHSLDYLCLRPLYCDDFYILCIFCVCIPLNLIVLSGGEDPALSGLEGATFLIPSLGGSSHGCF